MTIFDLSDAGFTALDVFVNDQHLLDEALQHIAAGEDVTSGEMEALMWLGYIDKGAP